MFLPHPRVKVSIVGSLRDREVACSASDRQGSNFESCVWRTVSSQSCHHSQEVLLTQFSLYVHKGGLKPDSFHSNRWLCFSYCHWYAMVFINHIHVRDALLVNHVSCGPLRVVHVASLLAVLFFIIVCFDSHIFRNKIDVNSHHNTALLISRTSPWRGRAFSGLVAFFLTPSFSCFHVMSQSIMHILTLFVIGLLFA